MSTVVHMLNGGVPQAVVQSTQQSVGKSTCLYELARRLGMGAVTPNTTVDTAVVTSRQNRSDKFAIYLSTLAGQKRALIFSDPSREVNHARVSPDGNWVVFTRYNTFNSKREALEVNGYFKTEIIRCRIDGSDCTALVPARDGIISANAYWTSDGRNLLFVSNETPHGRPGIKELEIETETLTTFYAPDDLIVADPHMVDRVLVMPGRSPDEPGLSRLYLLDLRTKQRRELTDPKFSNFRNMVPPLGDHDPKLSNDGTKVVVMRHMNRDDWSIVVIETTTGIEHDLSQPHAVDAVPEWSSDGRRLIFWSVIRENLKQSGLYSMRSDGTDRQRVPLPSGFFYTMPAFVPGTGSGPDSRIIYSTRPNARM